MYWDLQLNLSTGFGFKIVRSMTIFGFQWEDASNERKESRVR